MKTITVRKDVTINTGNFTNIKLGAELATDEMDWQQAWSEVKSQIYEQELLVKSPPADPNLKEEMPF